MGAPYKWRKKIELHCEQLSSLFTADVLSASQNRNDSVLGCMSLQPTANKLS